MAVTIFTLNQSLLNGELCIKIKENDKCYM